MKRFLLIFVVLFLPVYATCDPPTSGDWNILNTESCSNSSIQINITRDVHVAAGGYLYLNDVSLWVGQHLNISGKAHFTNVTLVMNDTSSSGFIRITDGGEWNITNQSRIQLGDTANAYYRLLISSTAPDSKLLINDTIMTGIHHTNLISGIVLNADNDVAIENSSLSSVSGLGGYIINDQNDRTRLFNVSISSFDSGVFFSGGATNYYDNISIVTAGGHGINYLGGTGLVINNSYIEVGGGAVAEVFSSGFEIYNSTLTGGVIEEILLSGATNSIIKNNSFVTSGTRAITLEGAANNNEISDNYISNGGIVITSSDDIWIVNNTIDGSTRIGISLNQSTGTVIDNNTIQNNNIGIQFSWYSSYSGITDVMNNNTLSNNIITLSFNNTNCTLFNVTMPPATTWNSTLSHNSQIVFENVSFTKTAINVSDTSVHTVKWYLDIRTLDAGGSVLENVSVTGSDQYATQQFATTTGTGGTATELVTEHYQNSTSEYTYEPYTTIGTLTGYLQGTSISYLDSNNVTLIYLTSVGESGDPGKDDKKDDEKLPIDEEETFEEWMERYDFDDPDDDPDNDGLTNREEYEYGTDPTRFTELIVIIKTGGGGEAPLTEEKERIVPVSIGNASFVIENEFGGTSIGVVLASGEERTKRILIYNTGTTAITVKLGCVGSVFTDEEKKLTQSDDVCSWVSFNQTEVDLIPNPQQKVPINIIIKVPENTSEREYYFSIVGNAVGSETAYSFPFLIDVSELGSYILNMFFKLGKVCWVGGPEGSAPIPIPIGGVIVLLSFVAFFIVRGLARFGPKDKEGYPYLSAVAPFIFLITFLFLLFFLPAC